jgi:chorismate synthase
MGNTFGTLLRLTTFGESHGPAMGGILDGMPPLVHIDLGEVRRHLDRRRPGSRPDISQRRESDEPEILSGLTPDGITLGSPIGFVVRNRDARSKDYDGYSGKFRPNHADYTYHTKYGIHDFRGGGRASARETVSWTVAGSIVRQWLSQRYGIEIEAEFIATNDVAATARQGDSTGGIVRCRVTGIPAGIGEPVFDKLHSRLAAAMMGINAAKGFEYGDGFRSASMKGSESVDIFCPVAGCEGNTEKATPTCRSNHSGGIQGGISNGMPVEFAVYFKPTPTIMRPLETIDTDGNSVILEPAGRHDPCVAIRAVPIVESMAALVIGDLIRQSCTGL